MSPVRSAWRIAGTPRRIGYGTLTVRYAVSLAGGVYFYKGGSLDSPYWADDSYACADGAFRYEGYTKYSFTKTWAVKPADSGE